VSHEDSADYQMCLTDLPDDEGDDYGSSDPDSDGHRT